MKNSGLLVWITMLVIVGIAFSGWDYNQSPRQAQDIIDVLITVPATTLDQYGHTERTRVLFNIAKLLEICRRYEIRVKALEVRVTELEKDVAIEIESAPIDVNGVEIVDPNKG